MWHSRASVGRWSPRPVSAGMRRPLTRSKSGIPRQASSGIPSGSKAPIRSAIRYAGRSAQGGHAIRVDGHGVEPGGQPTHRGFLVRNRPDGLRSRFDRLGRRPMDRRRRQRPRALCAVLGDLRCEVYGWPSHPAAPARASFTAANDSRLMDQLQEHLPGGERQRSELHQAGARHFRRGRHAGRQGQAPRVPRRIQGHRHAHATAAHVRDRAGGHQQREQERGTRHRVPQHVWADCDSDRRQQRRSSGAAAPPPAGGRGGFGGRGGSAEFGQPESCRLGRQLHSVRNALRHGILRWSRARMPPSAMSRFATIAPPTMCCSTRIWRPRRTRGFMPISSRPTPDLSVANGRLCPRRRRKGRVRGAQPEPELDADAAHHASRRPAKRWKPRASMSPRAGSTRSS